MKKTAVLGTLILLAGCAASPKAEQVETSQVATQETVNVGVTIPCSYSCGQSGGCYSEPQPILLKPRVTEVLRQHRKRPCCRDELVLPGEEDMVYVPDAPEIYVISANRTVNTMQKEAAPFFEQIGNIKVFVQETKLKSDDLPGGADKGTETLRHRFDNMSTVTVVDNKQKADFIINSVVDWYDTPTKKVPAIKYDLFLNAVDGRVIGEWSEIIHQAEGDRSWW